MILHKVSLSGDAFVPPYNPLVEATLEKICLGSSSPSFWLQLHRLILLSGSYTYLIPSAKMVKKKRHPCRLQIASEDASCLLWIYFKVFWQLWLWPPVLSVASQLLIDEEPIFAHIFRYTSSLIVVWTALLPQNSSHGISAIVSRRSALIHFFYFVFFCYSCHWSSTLRFIFDTSCYSIKLVNPSWDMTHVNISWTIKTFPAFHGWWWQYIPLLSGTWW